MKVYGWQGSRPHVGQTREIVAARSKAAAARAAGYDDPRQMFNLTDTGNIQEINVAHRNPGTVFWTPINTWVRSEKNSTS